MRGRETFYRSTELKRESRMLPAETYNLARILYRHSHEPVLFIPVRSLLYQAVIDGEEIVFLDGALSCGKIVLAWQKFRPQERRGLHEPIPYETVYYADEVLGTLPRLQGEFLRVLRQIREKSPMGPAEIIPLNRR